MVAFKRTFILTLTIAVMLTLSACFPFAAAEDVEDIGQVQTAAAQTVEVMLTRSVLETMIAQLTEPVESTAVPSETQLPPTEVLTNTPTNTPTDIPTLRPPTSTPVPPTATATPLPCDWVQFVADVTIPDGTTFLPSESFIKTWRLKNIGSCTWTEDYDLVFISGDAMNGPTAVSLDETVRPGETVDVSVKLIAPDSEGKHTGYWKLRNASNAVFGLGANAAKSFWVQINVDDSDGTWNPDDPLDFVSTYCKARWYSAEGVLGCPGAVDDFTDGSITRVSSPRLEGGYQDDEPALVMIPSSGDGGMIYGRYPEIKIKDGDRFTALVGCMYDSPKCDVTFKLNYSADGGTVKNLGSWEEKSDGDYTRINVDLSSMAGKNVVLTLKVENNGSSKDDRVFWLVPVIKRK